MDLEGTPLVTTPNSRDIVKAYLVSYCYIKINIMDFVSDLHMVL